MAFMNPSGCSFFFLAQLTGYVFLQAGIVPYSVTRNNKALLSTPTKK